MTITPTKTRSPRETSPGTLNTAMLGALDNRVQVSPRWYSISNLLRHWTIRRRLVLLYTSLLTITIILFAIVVLSMTRRSWIELVDDKLLQIGQQVLSNSEVYAVRESGVLRWEVNLPERDIFQSPGVFVQAWRMDNNDQQLRASSATLGSYREPLDPTVLGAGELVYSNVVIDGIELRVLTGPLLVRGQTAIWGNVQAAVSLQDINFAIGRLSLLMVLIGLGVTLASFALGLWLSNQATRPVEAIAQAASRISTAQDLQTRLQWDGPNDEIGRLVDVFNSMMNRLEKVFGVQERLVHDVSHELRTPLTAIKGNVDIIKRYGMDAMSLEAIEAETERMTRLVADLLTLARVDYGSAKLDLFPVDLDTVLSNVYQEAVVLSHDRDLTIRLGELQPARILGNQDRLVQLLLNLVSNAIKYTPDGGSITLALSKNDTQAIMTVSDTGIGISAENLTRIFDRFYQADSSRVRGAEGGAGLGLSIAKWIVEAHSGAMEVSSELGKGSTFTVCIPLADVAPCPLGVHEEKTPLFIPAWFRRH